MVMAAACTTESPVAPPTPVTDGPALTISGSDCASKPGRTVLATGSLVVGTTVFPNAVVTYDACLDASDLGTNPGIELWRTAADAIAGANRVARSNDNNGQWDYRIEGAYFAGGTVVVLGSRTGSHGPQGSSWTYNGGSFLTLAAASFSCAPATLTDRRVSFGPFPITRGSQSYPAAFVTYDPALDATDAGSNPGIEVWPSAAARDSRTGRLARSNDNNGQWDYRVDCVHVAGGIATVIGARSANGGATFLPRLWVDQGTAFLIQYSGI
jgi:hypothetical protein